MFQGVNIFKFRVIHIGFSLIILAMSCLLMAMKWSLGSELDPVACQELILTKTGNCVNGKPFLISNDLPYPVYRDSTSNLIHDLNGQWMVRVDSIEKAGQPSISGFIKDPGRWVPITIPSTYNHPGSQFNLHQGITWYKKSFYVTPETKNHFFRLAFMGVLLRSEVWLNGVYLGGREGGYTPFYFDVSDYLKRGKNTLLLKADNRLTYSSLPPKVRTEHNPVWAPYGGIFRPVYLEKLPRQYVFKVNTQTRTLNHQEVYLTGSVFINHHENKDPYCLNINLISPMGIAIEGKQICDTPENSFDTHPFDFKVENPKWWSTTTPNLYTVRTRIKTINTEEMNHFKTGLRTVGTNKQQFLVNGQPTFLKGISKMEDNPATGQTQTPGLIQQDLSLIKDMNANFIRLSHYPHDVDFLTAARDSGIMVSGEIPYFHVGAGWTQWMVDFKSVRHFPWKQFGTLQMGDEELLQNTRRQLLEMVERDRNNPAVILWFLANESYSLSEKSVKIYSWLKKNLLFFDSTRPVTAAEMTYYLPILDARRKSSKALDVSSLNLYFGWYYGEAEDARDHIRNFRKRFPGQPVFLSEFGAEAVANEHLENFSAKGNRVFFDRDYSENYQAQLLQTYLEIAFDLPYVMGVSPWCFSDFYSPWFPDNPVAHYNTKGVVDKNRNLKKGYFILKNFYGQIANSGHPTADTIKSLTAAIKDIPRPLN